jgi:dolichol-phosphate mannosyltransferase
MKLKSRKAAWNSGKEWRVRSKMLVSIVIPTYNESKNINTLIPEIFSIAKKSNLNLEVVVVDDGSPDGTGEIAKKLAENYAVRVYIRSKKQGLGSAYKFGFSKTKGDVIMEMDADWSHDPKYLPGILNKIQQGFDVVIGSRYISGGKRGDGSQRSILPIIGCKLFNVLLGIEIKDVFSGYRAYSKSALGKINLETLPDDFSFQSQILYELKNSGAKLTEVPITFTARKAGQAKYTHKEARANFKVLTKLCLLRVLKHIE